MYRQPKKTSRKPLPPAYASPPRPGEKTLLSASLEENFQRLQEILGLNQDAVFREFQVGLTGARAAVVYLDGMVDSVAVNDMTLKSLMLVSAQAGEGMAGLGGEPARGRPALDLVRQRLLTLGSVNEEERLEDLLTSILSGDTAFLLEGATAALILSARGYKSRGVEQPTTEFVIRGPREGFTENLRVNTSLLRRRLRDPDFLLVGFQVGKRTKTDCVLAYVRGIVKPELLGELEKRLHSFNVDGVLEGGVLEQFLEDSYLSPFPQVQYTERPDKVVANILEGRVAILVDGSPLALLIPATFPMFFQSPEDYYERWIIASVTRVLRLVASYMATFAPSIYVAIISFHPGLLPTKLALTLAASRQGVPFPAVVEALIMEVSFELLREAGARLPQPIGQTVGIVGGLIIGQSAVSAGLVSPIIIIVVAMTAIASFSIPSYNLAIGFRLLRFPLLLAAGVLGLYGVVLGFIIINIHMVTLKSFGTSYLSPLAPYRYRDWKDTLIRSPWRRLDTRPLVTKAVDETRQEKPTGGEMS